MKKCLAAVAALMTMMSGMALAEEAATPMAEPAAVADGGMMQRMQEMHRQRMEMMGRGPAGMPMMGPGGMHRPEMMQRMQAMQAQRGQVPEAMAERMRQMQEMQEMHRQRMQTMRQPSAAAAEPSAEAPAALPAEPATQAEAGPMPPPAGMPPMRGMGGCMDGKYAGGGHRQGQHRADKMAHRRIMEDRMANIERMLQELLDMQKAAR